VDPASAFGITAAAGVGVGTISPAHQPDDDGGSAPNDGPGPDGPPVSSLFVPGQLVFPVAKWQGIAPERSQEYRAADHHGVDLMFSRAAAYGADAPYLAGTPNGTARWFMPEDQWAIACADAAIWSTGLGPTGIFVVLDHGAPYATFYVHLDTLDDAIPMNISRGEGKIAIAAGQRLGRIGFSPRDQAKLKHLHFEVWKDGGSEAHIDPWPLIQGARMIES